ncbi:hypothetical protein PL75_03210 [Neisseria arctica]|uniref:Tetratricopeptide repeat protein n=1 Tax=Neisseria arctica TaxID=1470200 RepID=A0A0J0YSW8_9NEIS|nr:hypothetical protein [Neisseria arctica]KLT73250.1 hypothetical protein PL75_03210 [Neisseria arctica]UOO87498.1 hypothetical protein LVJ86_04435 [Neisseria arctica]
MIQPKTKSEELFRKIEALYEQDKPVLPLQIQRLKQDVIKSVFSESVGLGHVLYGLITGLENKPDEIASRYRQAQHYLNDCLITHMNFMTAFKYVGQYHEAGRAFEAAFETVDPSNPFQLRCMISHAARLGFYKKGQTAIELLQKLNEVPDTAERATLKSLEDFSMKEQELTGLIAQILSFLHSKGIHKRLNHIETSHLCEDGENFHVYSVLLDGQEPEEIAQYQYECDNVLADFANEKGIDLSNFVVNILPIEA